jgi:hypothetical protein
VARGGSGLKLRIAAKIDDADQTYFREQIEPLFADAFVEFSAEVGRNGERRTSRRAPGPPLSDRLAARAVRSS